MNNVSSLTAVDDTLRYYTTAPTYIFKLPSRFNDKKYAERFTPVQTGKVTGIRFFVYAVQGSGTLNVAIHDATSGSLGGIPSINPIHNSPISVTKLFSQLSVNNWNFIDLSSLNVTTFANVDYHIVMSVTGVAGDTISLLTDSTLSGPSTRASSYWPFNGTDQWQNFKDPNNYAYGINFCWDIIVSPSSTIPTITTFSPASGSIATSVTITGTGFSSTASNNIVYFGGVKATVTAATATQLTVTVPAGATYKPISVTVAGLTGYSLKPFIVTFNGGGSITTSSFATKVDFVTGNGNWRSALGDLDGDGKLDMAILNGVIVSVFRNTSVSGSITTSSFASRVDFTTGAGPNSVEIGDLDGDGKLDLVTSNGSSNTVSVFRNTSSSGAITTGSFAAKTDFATGLVPFGVAMGDLDGDGKPEIVVANSNSSTISIFRNTSSSGSITFASKIDFTVGTNPYNVSIGDVDGDAKPDLCVANYGSNTISVFRNTSSSGSITSGSFATKVDFTTGANPSNISIGDIDGDGKSDLAVTNYSGNSFSIFRNTSSSGSITSGSFATKVDFTTGIQPYSFAINDLDGDGKLDVAALSTNGNAVSIFKNTSSSGNITTGSFASKVDFTTGASPFAVSTGDLDGDGKPDLAIANGSNSAVSVFRNTVIAGNLPSAPTNFVATPVSSSQANLSWTASATGSPTLYRIYRSATSGSGYTKIDSVGSSQTSYSNTGLTANTIYWYRVTAINALGESSTSNEDSAKTFVAPTSVPSAPTNFLATPISSSQANLSWTASATGSPTLYRIYRSATSGSGYNKIDSVSSSQTSYSNTGLTSSTVYWYRVSALNSVGESSVSNEDSAKTFTASSAAVISIPTTLAFGSVTPGTSLQKILTIGNTGNVALTGSISVPANSGYTISTTTLNVTAGSTQNVTVTFSPLAAQNYNTSITVTHNAVGSPSTVALSGTGLTSPTVATIAVSSTSLLIMKNGTTGTFSSVSVTISNGGQQTLTGSVAYSGTSFLQLSTGSSLSVVGGGSTQITIQHNISQALTAGTYTGNITITHNAAGGTTTIPVELRVVAIPATISVNKTITFTNPENSLSYQLVSIPGTTTYGASSVLQGEHKTDWRLYRDNGAATNYLVEYNGSSAFNFGPGKGFWLLSKKGLSVSAIVNSATSTTGAYAVALQSGWNIISTPYEKSVSWNDVKKYNSLATNAVIYGWSNGVWTQALSMSPYKAYYYNNIPNAASILIPYDPSGSLSKTVNEADNLPFISSRAIHLSLSSDGSDIASVYAGFDSTSSTDYDNNDYFAPPQAFATSSIVIENDAPHMPQKKLYIDHRKEIGEGQIFNLAVHNSTNSTSYLTASGMNTLPNDEVYLYNVDSKMSFNLKEQQHVVIPSSSEELHFQLIIGSKAFVEKKGISLMPTEYALFQNYPNPFNPTTVISYSIPAEGHVVLKLYDILGHEIKQIVNEHQTPGNYVYQIDGRTLATGVYFYTIRAGAFVSSKKMLLMK